MISSGKINNKFIKMEETKLRQLFKNRADAYLNTIDESVEQGMSEDCFIKTLKEAINYTRCCTELKDKKGTDFEEFCSEHFIYKNSNTYSKESGLPVSLNDMLQKYKDLKT